MATTETVENGSTKTTLSDSQRVASDGAATAVSTSSAAVVDTSINPVTDENQNAVVESDSAPASESDVQPTTTATTTNSNATATATSTAAAAADKKWPGWPGDCVFRLIVPVAKVGGIIGRKGELIKKMCEETHARIRVLDGPVGTPDRIVLISGKEEPDAPLSPAMDAVIRIFKRVSGLSEAEGDASLFGAAAVVFCSIRLLVASTQAINLIGKQGSLIKSIQESTAASVRVLSGDEVPFYAASDERIVELQGEASKVLKALEAVIGHLRKFLVDHSVLPLFEKNYNATITQERQVIVDNTPRAEKSLLHTTSQTGVGTNYPLSSKRDSLYLDREPQLEAQLPSSGISIYGQDPTFSGIRSSGLGRAGAPIVTQITQTMQIPLSYAEDIIGIEGSNIAYIRRTSGAILTVQEIRGVPDEITVEIKGTSSQVQLAQQLIQEVISNHQDPLTSTYGRIDAGLRSSYSQLNNTAYPSSSLSSQTYGVYGSSGLGGYSTFRL